MKARLGAYAEDDVAPSDEEGTRRCGAWVEQYAPSVQRTAEAISAELGYR